MRMTMAGTLAAAMLLSTSNAAMAQALAWRLSETAGPVTIQHGGVSRSATRGATLAEGDVVQTGGGGRAVLVHDRDFVTVAPNSRVAVPQAAQASGLTKLIQTLGNAVYKIEKLGVPHFGVSTPYLAAVVKGTTFSVTVDGTGSSLQVTEGAVEVATLDGGARDLVRPGAVASIAAGDLYRLKVQGDAERTIDSPARPASSAPAQPATSTPQAAVAEPEAANAQTLAPAAAPTPEVVAVQAPADVGGAVVVGADVGNELGEAMLPKIIETISSKPTDLGSITGGLVSGTIAPVVTVAAATVDRVRLAAEVKGDVPGMTPVADTGAADKGGNVAPVTNTPKPEEVASAPEPVRVTPTPDGTASSPAPVSDAPKPNEAVSSPVPVKDAPKPDEAVSSPVPVKDAPKPDEAVSSPEPVKDAPKPDGAATAPEPGKDAPGADDKANKPDKGEKPEAEKDAPKPDKGEKPEAEKDAPKPDKGEKPEAEKDAPKPDKTEKPEAEKDTPKPDKVEKPEAEKDMLKPDKVEKPEAEKDTPKPDKVEKPEAEKDAPKPEKDAPTTPGGLLPGLVKDLTQPVKEIVDPVKDALIPGSKPKD